MPGLLDNLLRIEHLDRAGGARGDRAADRAVEPSWGRRGRRGEIEPALVETVLGQVEEGKVVPAMRGRAATTAGVARIGAPYLQLVLTRLWDEERAPDRTCSG